MNNAHKEILDNFFGMILEDSINDNMMEFSYKFPYDGMKEYALEICGIPFHVFLEYINKYQENDVISADCVSQFSKLDDCLLGFCEATDNMRRPLTFEEIGERLQDDGVYRNSVANIKYGENHSKMALQFGLAQCRYNYWYISALGKVFSQLPKEKQDALMIRTLLRNKLYALIFTRLQNHDVSIENILRNVNLSDSTRTRRLSSVKSILIWCFGVLNKEKFRYNHKIVELSLLVQNHNNLPINYARRAHVELLKNGTYKDKYLSLLNRIPRLSEEEEIDLYKKYKKGDLEAYHALCEACLPFVNTLANNLVNQYPEVDVLDLIGEGVCGLCTAISKFSTSYNARLITYAMHWVRQYMYHYIKYTNPFIHIPADVLSLNRKISKISEKYYAEDKYISLEEIADILGFPLDKVIDSNEISDKEVVSVGLSCAFDNFRSEDFNYDNLYFESLSHEIDRALEQLTPREAGILRSYFGIDVPEKELEDIGKELDLTRERIRQIKEEAVRKLKTCSRSGILKTYLDEIPYHKLEPIIELSDSSEEEILIESPMHESAANSTEEQKQEQSEKNDDINDVLAEKVEVIDGPFTGFEGVIQTYDHDTKHFIVIVSIFNRETPLKLNANQIILKGETVNYEFHKYIKQLSQMNCCKKNNEVAPHKPVLLLALIDYIEEKMRTAEGRAELNLPIPFRPTLESKFKCVWNRHVHSEVFKPSFANPIIHMQNEPFYHLMPYADRVYDGTHSMLAVESAFQGIQLDSELMQLIIQQDTRQQLRQLLIDMI